MMGLGPEANAQDTSERQVKECNSSAEAEVVADAADDNGYHSAAARKPPT